MAAGRASPKLHTLSLEPVRASLIKFLAMTTIISTIYPETIFPKNQGLMPFKAEGRRLLPCYFGVETILL